MPERNATVSNARELGPEVLRNEIVEKVDQMERIEMGDNQQYVSAMSMFPMVNLDDPDEAYYTMGGATGPMSPVDITSESPVGQLDLPSKESVEITSYKKKYIPDKGVETHLSNTTPFSLFTRAASQLRKDIFITREQVAWRGDEVIDGMVGQFGDDPHPDIKYAETPDFSWDTDDATVYDDISDLAFEIWDNGLFTNGEPAKPLVIAPPSAVRDARQNPDMEDRVSGVQVRSLSTGDVESLLEDEIGGIRQCLVNLPRQNEAGEYIDEDGEVVDNIDDAAFDNALEPYDPATGEKNRNVIIGRPGVNSAYMPWFSDRLLERAEQAADPGSISVDNSNGFFTQVWNSNDPITANFKAGQEIGLEIHTPENWALLQDV